MKVRDLIEALQNMDPAAEVLLMTQPSYPFENYCTGVVQRRDFTEYDDEADEEDNAGERSFHGSDCADPTDVFLLDGGQARYGSKAAWECEQ